MQTEAMKEAIVDAFPNGIALSRPKGGHLLWCQLPKRLDAVELFQRTLLIILLLLLLIGGGGFYLGGPAYGGSGLGVVLVILLVLYLLGVFGTA